ncbi:hypothetical protein KNE206_12520 [Kitasatospora sp. NE20-6]
MCRIQKGRNTAPRGKGAGLDGLQALAAAAKKKQPVTHDVHQRNPGAGAYEAGPAAIPPTETDGTPQGW